MCFGVTLMVMVAKKGEAAELPREVRMVAIFPDLGIIYTTVLRN